MYRPRGVSEREPTTLTQDWRKGSVTSIIVEPLDRKGLVGVGVRSSDVSCQELLQQPVLE